MVSIRRNRLYVLGAALLTITITLFLPFSLAQAEEKNPQPDQSRPDSVSQNCASIKQSLRQLQRADSRTRTYLGSSYQTVLGNFITPLNLRLVKNNLPDAKLVEIQADFTSTQTKFRNDYTDYMRELESLIATDCQAHPQEFYDQLLVTRARRSTLQESTARLTMLIQNQIEAATTLKEGL